MGVRVPVMVLWGTAGGTVRKANCTKCFSLSNFKILKARSIENLENGQVVEMLPFQCSCLHCKIERTYIIEVHLPKINYTGEGGSKNNILKGVH